MSPSQADEVRVGAVLGGTYEITSVIGEGGMGTVFAARHLRLPKQVAVKVLKTGLALSPDIVARFRREAEIASRLGHPNIVEVLDFDTLPGGTPFLVLEFLRGESLGQRLERGPLNWEETREVALQVGSALLAAHRAGVVHRDLKPDNIFLLPGDSAGTTRHRVKLLDFGISKLTDRGTLKTQDAVLMGTPQYMSPEQALGNNSAIDARSDVFALGCIYYEMLSGRPAFSGDNLPTVVYRIVHEQPRPLPDLVPDLLPHAWPALQRALAKQAEQRTPDVATLTEELTGTRLRERTGAAQDDTHVPSSTPVPHRRANPSSEGGPAALEATHVPGLEDTHVPGAAAALASTHVPAATPTPGRAPTPSPGDAPLDATFVPSATPANGPAEPAQPLDRTHVPARAVQDDRGAVPVTAQAQRADMAAGALAAPHAATALPGSASEGQGPESAHVVPAVVAGTSSNVPGTRPAPVGTAPAQAQAQGVALPAVIGAVVLALGAGLFFASNRKSPVHEALTTPRAHGEAPLPGTQAFPPGAVPVPGASGDVPAVAAQRVPGAGNVPSTTARGDSPTPTALPEPAAGTAVNPAARNDAPTPGPLPAPAAGGVPNLASQATPPTKPVERPAARPARAAAQERLEPTVPRALEELTRAEAALTENRLKDAVFRADQSIRFERSGRALSVLTRALCSQRDVGRVNAEFQKVPPALRGECIQWCRQFDIDLGSR